MYVNRNYPTDDVYGSNTGVLRADIPVQHSTLVALVGYAVMLNFCIQEAEYALTISRFYEQQKFVFKVLLIEVNGMSN